MWTFYRIDGQIFNEQKTLETTAYAGRGDGKNNPTMENVKGVGPLPAGKYTAVEWFDHHPTVGKDAMRLEPDEATRMKIVAYGRNPDSFFMHGDDREHPGLASHGCIVAANPERHKFWEKTDRVIEVV